MGGGGALVQARKERGRSEAVLWAAQRGSLLGRQGRGLRRFRGGVAALQPGGAQRPAIDDEAVESPGALGQRLAEHEGAAFVGRALACGWTAAPDDVASEELAGNWRNRLTRIIGGGGRGG